MPLGTEVGLGQGHIVLHRDPAPHPKRGTHTQFSAKVSNGQTAGWIKIPLGTEIGLGPGHIVSDGEPTPSTEKGTAAPTFYGRPME